jgi:hypothetical protein
MYVSLLQNLNSLFEINSDGCIWLLKLLTQKPESIVERLLECRSEEEREHFRAVLISAISLVAKNEEKEFFDETGENYQTIPIVSYDKTKDTFYSDRVPKSALIRFMQIFFEKLLEAARLNWKKYEDYFQVLFYFAKLGHLETKYLVKAGGINKLLDFIMNNSPPFSHGKAKEKMGSAIADPNFKTPIDILSHLIRSCITFGIKQTESYSSVSLIQNAEHHIELPVDEVQPLMTRLCFTVDLINKQYNDAILSIVLHLCWGDYDNSLFFLSELMFSSNIQKGNITELRKRIRILSEIIKIEDILQEARIELVLGLKDTRASGLSKIESHKIEENCLLHNAETYRNDYPFFTLKVIKLIADMCENPKMYLYLTKNRSKIMWIRDFLDNLKSNENSELNEKLNPQSAVYDKEDFMILVDACMDLLTQVFSEGNSGFRFKHFNRQKERDKDEGKGIKQVTSHFDLNEQQPEVPLFNSFDGDTGGFVQEADDDFKNVSSAPPPKEKSEENQPEAREDRDVNMRDAQEEEEQRLTDVELDQNDSFSK